MVLDRRAFLELLALAAAGCATAPPRRDEAVFLNDIHSQLNRTRVARIVTPQSVDDLRRMLAGTKDAISIAGGRHAMGGQQFGTGTTHIDTRAMARVIAFDDANGIIDVESGIQWPALVDHLKTTKWAIRQKQTGADRLCIGGALAANVHGRGLTMKPIIADVDSFVLVDANGERHECSRTQNRELFAHAIGGYGLFGVIGNVRLRLARRRKVRRVVEEERIENIIRRFDERIAAGFTYGDFQFAISEASEDFLRKGVFSCYQPVDDDTPIAAQAELKPEDWMRLLALAHADKEQAYQRYAAYYLSTSGQVYWSDEQQLSFYPDDYHLSLDALLKTARATEMITELYVPRPRLADFMLACADELRKRKTSVIYGTVRLIERDDESVLAWAKESYACVVMNLHIEHSDEGIARAKDDLRKLIDLALDRGGSFYLTYHRWARADQVRKAYPQFASFLDAKRRYDPRERFASDWYRDLAPL